MTRKPSTSTDLCSRGMHPAAMIRRTWRGQPVWTCGPCWDQMNAEVAAIRDAEPDRDEQPRCSDAGWAALDVPGNRRVLYELPDHRAAGWGRTPGGAA
jgi:hypothetical protein